MHFASNEKYHKILNVGKGSLTKKEFFWQKHKIFRDS